MPETEIEPLSHAEASEKAFHTGQNVNTVIEDHRLRRAPTLPPALESARDGLSKAELARQKAEEKWSEARNIQSTYDARLAEADRQRNEIAMGTAELASATEGAQATLRRLEDWPREAERNYPGHLEAMRVQLDSCEFWKSFLPGWLERRQAALAAYEAATEMMQGITAKK